MPDLRDRIPRDAAIGPATADGACDTRRRRSARVARGGTAFGHAPGAMAVQWLTPDHQTARPPDRQTAEIQFRTALVNRPDALGTADIVRLA